jgi:hypothetical protein
LRKREEGRGKTEEGRRKREDGRGKTEEGKGGRGGGASEGGGRREDRLKAGLRTRRAAGAGGPGGGLVGMSRFAGRAEICRADMLWWKGRALKMLGAQPVGAGSRKMKGGVEK